MYTGTLILLDNYPVVKISVGLKYVHREYIQYTHTYEHTSRDWNGCVIPSTRTGIPGPGRGQRTFSPPGPYPAQVWCELSLHVKLTKSFLWPDILNISSLYPVLE